MLDKMWGYLGVLSLLITSIQLSSTPKQETAEELFQVLKHQFAQTALLNGITSSYPSYNRMELIDILGPKYVETYDFIIIGAGSAGTAVANRLSENRKWKVLLLEAGDQGDFMADIPAFAGFQQFTEHNWGYLTEVQENMGLGLKDGRVNWARGKGLGGSSLINFMMDVRGNKADYDNWASLGNEGWSYEEVLPYFKKVEDSWVLTDDDLYRGFGGPITVEDVAYRTSSANAFINACANSGYPYVDYNGARQIGVSYVQATTRHGLRCSGEKGYLRPARTRPNLRIRPNSFVSNILIDKYKRAYGVHFIRNGLTYLVRASKEVILSAGVISSPHILMLSGVGPRNHLQELGIPLKKDLPVGQKLYDHLAYLGLFYKLNQSVGFNLTEWFSPLSFAELYTTGTGPLTSLGGVEAVAFYKTNVSSDLNPSHPDVEFIFMGLHLNSDNGLILSRMFRIKEDIYNSVYKPLEGQPTVGIMPMTLHPQSYGYMRLRSADPFDHPKLHGNYLTDPGGLDIKTHIASIREVQKIFRTPAFKRYGAEQVTTVVPGCDKHTYDSDSYLECALRTLSVSLFHQVGTCRMGPAADPEAVVDARLRVYGIRNLRVIDTSIIPVTISGHTNVPAYMVGEKGADIIKEDWSVFSFP